MPSPTLRFQVTAESGLTQQAVNRATFCGLDQIPVPCRAVLRDQMITIDRPVPESGKIQMPLRVEGYGELMLSTGTLMYRERPYYLEVELARGKVNQIRNQLADWSSLGLQIPPAVEAAVQKMVRECAKSIVHLRQDPAFAIAQARKAIQAAVHAGDLIADTYVEQALGLRHRMSAPLPTWLSVPLPIQTLPTPLADSIQTAFNTFTVPFSWRNVEPREGQYSWDTFDSLLEWCQAHGAPVIGGPLIWLDPEGMPDWTKTLPRDPEGVYLFACEYVSTLVKRYRGRVSLWEVGARLNSADAWQLAEEQRLQFAIKLIETARRNDPDTPCILRFDQPWGEYLAGGREFDLTPLHFADALVRSGLQLGGIGLEFNIAYLPRGTAWRDRLDFSRLLDMWSYLGLPLHLTITAPSRDTADARARPEIKAVSNSTAWSNDLQAHYAQELLPLFLSKAFVHSVTWGQLSDADPHEFPHSGVIDEFGRPKPALAALAHLRRLHLH